MLLSASSGRSQRFKHKRVHCKKNTYWFWNNRYPATTHKNFFLCEDNEIKITYASISDYEWWNSVPHSEDNGQRSVSTIMGWRLDSLLGGMHWQRIRATVKILREQFFHTLCCLRRKDSRISMPPSSDEGVKDAMWQRCILSHYQTNCTIMTDWRTRWMRQKGWAPVATNATPPPPH